MSLKEEGNWIHPCTEGRLSRNTQREVGHVKMKAKIGVILPQAREHPGLREAGTVRNPFLKASGIVWPCQHFDLGLLTYRTVRQPPDLCYFIMAALGN